MKKRDLVNEYSKYVGPICLLGFFGTIIGGLGYAGVRLIQHDLSRSERRVQERDENRLIEQSLQIDRDGASVILAGDNALRVKYDENTVFTIDLDDQTVITHGRESSTQRAESFEAFNNAALIESVREAGCVIAREQIATLPDQTNFDDHRETLATTKTRAVAFSGAYCGTPAP